MYVKKVKNYLCVIDKYQATNNYRKVQILKFWD